MPYDDSNVKKMIRDQLEKKVAFSKSKPITREVKDLITHILEVSILRTHTHIHRRESIVYRKKYGEKNIQRVEYKNAIQSF